MLISLKINIILLLYNKYICHLCIKTEHKECDWDDIEHVGKKIINKLDIFFNGQNEYQVIKKKK